MINAEKSSKAFIRVAYNSQLKDRKIWKKQVTQREKDRLANLKPRVDSHRTTPCSSRALTEPGSARFLNTNGLTFSKAVTKFMPTTDNIIPEEGAQPDITAEDNAQRGIPKEIIKINVNVKNTFIIIKNLL